MMNMNDGREVVFISSTFHTSYRHRGGRSAVFTELNMDHMRISRVCVVCGTLHYAPFEFKCVQHSVFLCECLCVCVCVCVSIKNERPARANER